MLMLSRLQREVDHAQSGLKEARFLTTKNKFLVLWVFFMFLSFNLQMLDTKLQPTNTMKSKEKSSEQRFGHVNAISRNSYLIIIFIKLVTQ